MSIFKEELVMLNCHGLFRAEEIWFLEENSEFKNRRLELGHCPYCDNWIVGLFQRSKADNKLYFVRARDKRAKRLYEALKSQIDYKKSDIAKGSKSNMGFVYGKNVVIYADGENFVLQKAVDFNGTEKIVKRIKTKGV